MNGQVNKKRNIIIGGNTIKVDSKRITIGDIKVGKTKIDNIWYIFDLDTGKVIYQGYKWNDCLSGVKEFIKEYL